MLYVLGIAICCAVLLQMGMWLTGSLNALQFNRRQYEASRQLFEQQLRAAVPSKTDPTTQPGSWKGFREFVVDRIEKEVDMVTSVYLAPVDGKPIATWQAGQYLPLRFQLPGEPKPVVRCYSLSTGPTASRYRISVKAVAAPSGQDDVQPGLVSNYINRDLIEGDIVDVRAPAGTFVLDDRGTAPIVLLAGGIGITPMISMLEDLVSKNSDRLIVLFYGVRCSREHAFKNWLKQVSDSHDNIHVVTCYSDPEPDDRVGDDYQVRGFVNLDLMKTLLPSNRGRFYLCGPPPFMESLMQGLLQWQVPENRIHFEAFGPATVKKTKTKASPEIQAGSHANAGQVAFAKSQVTTVWPGDCDSLLELAEQKDVTIESGCRAGSCLTCSTPLVGGTVEYPDGMDIDCESGHCLPCVAKPNGDVELEA